MAALPPPFTTFFSFFYECRRPDAARSNWDYRFSWVRDSSFTIYILLRLGFSEEANAYMDFISERILKSRSPDGGLPIMFTIRGETEIPEIELDHLDGYRGSRPVRIGNGAAFHQQFDIYGELLDAVYLNNKYGKPATWDQWVNVRQLLGESSPSPSRSLPASLMLTTPPRLRPHHHARYGSI